jgi:tetratricopeptide (TPR) repeat protein
MRSLPLMALLLALSNSAPCQPSAATASIETSDQSPADVNNSSSAGQAATPNPEETVAAAHQLLEHGKAQEAITMLEHLAGSSGKRPKGLQHELGIAYYRTGKLVTAEQAFAKAIKDDPSDLESVQTRGLTLYRICRPNTNGSAYNLGAGKFDAATDSVQYFTASPYELGGSNCGTSQNQPCPTSFGPYVRPAIRTFGNIYRDSLYGPGYFNTDLSVYKGFLLTQSLSFQFRADAFNLFNRANFGEPNPCVDCQGSQAGLITSTVASQDGSSMRRLQLVVRFEF